MTSRFSRNVDIVTEGAFGQAIARQLLTLCPHARETSGETVRQNASWRGEGVCLLAAWRPTVDLCERLETMSYETGVPFVACDVDDPVLTIGPIVVPGGGACWSCYWRRTQQHASWPDRRAKLQSFYHRHTSAGPAGYLEPFAMIAAARLCQIVADLENGHAIASEVLRLDMLTRNFTVSKVVGVHDCPRCGLRRPADTRTTSEMRQALLHLWP